VLRAPAVDNTTKTMSLGGEGGASMLLPKCEREEGLLLSLVHRHFPLVVWVLVSCCAVLVFFIVFSCLQVTTSFI
jgi:hypothetical protein